jgi:hypothetical protein
MKRKVTFIYFDAGRACNSARTDLRGGATSDGRPYRDRYRFAAMSRETAKSATQLYEMFSRFNVHGGTMSSLVGIAVQPTENSCAFHNRSLDEVGRNLPLFKPILEITAIELMGLVGRYGRRSKRIDQAGAYVLVWLDPTDPRWLERLQAVRSDFGLVKRHSPAN